MQLRQTTDIFKITSGEMSLCFENGKIIYQLPRYLNGYEITNKLEYVGLKYKGKN